MDKNTKTYNENNIFAAKSFDPTFSKQTIAIEINENKVTKLEHNKLIETMGNFHQQLLAKFPEKTRNEITFVKLNRNLDENTKFKIYVRDDVKAVNNIRAH